MKLTPELKNVLAISEKIEVSSPTKDNSKYSNWEYYQFNFKINDKTFSGLVNIGIDKNGNKHFYEVNNIQNLDTKKRTSGISETSPNRPTSSLPDNISQNKTDVKFSLTDNQGRTLTKEKQEYFKDSKVRDENGNLLTVYHGSENEFNTFDIDRAGARGSYYTSGFYFTTSKESAKDYATNKGKIYETYLNITKPYTPSADIINEDGSVTFAPSFYEEFEQKFKDRLPIDWKELNSARKGTAARYILEDLGYDGVINGDVYVTFNSNQIKNIDNINPTSNEDIRYSLSEKG